MAILTAILNAIASIFSEVFKHVLSTPAEETSIEEMDNDFILPDTPVDELLNRGEVKE